MTKRIKKLMSKRLIVLGLVLILTFALCGCSDADDTQTTGGTESSTIVDATTTDDNGDVDATVDTETTTNASDADTTTGESDLSDTETTASEVGSDEETTIAEDESGESVTTTKEEQTTTKKPEQTTTAKQEQTTTKKPEQTTAKQEQTTTKKPEQTTTAKQEETTTKPSSSSDNKIEKTNAGYASEVIMTASGNYTYVTNKKQIIDAVKGNAFFLSPSELTVGEMYATNISSYIYGDYGTIQWISEDPSIAQIIGTDLVGISVGTTKISGTCGDTTVHLTVTVIENYGDICLNSQIVTLFTNESYQLLANKKGAVFTSVDPSIAKVSADGVVTGVKPGSTIIKASFNGKECECKVTVAEDDGTYMSSTLDTKYTIAKERILLASERALIILDPGTVIEDNLLENIEILLDEIEKRTGYSFKGNEKITDNFLSDRIIIGAEMSSPACGGAFGVIVAPYDLAIKECGAHVLTHELLHTIQYRNTAYTGYAITEGYAEYFGIDVYMNLSISKTLYDEYYNSWANMSIEFGDITLTDDNIRQYLINPPDPHPISFFFVSYLVEKYGEAKIKEIQKAITDEYLKHTDYPCGGGIVDSFTDADMFAIVESKTSANVAKDFLAYFNGLEERNQAPVFDMSEHTGVYDVRFTGHRAGNFTDICGDLILNGPLVVDLTHLIDYAQKVYGRKMKGVNAKGMFASDGSYADIEVAYYDAAGNIMKVPEDFDVNDGRLQAVRIKYDMKTPGVMRTFLTLSFDEYYEW